MAIAPSPLAALPPGDEASWPREVAIPWQYRAPDALGGLDGCPPEPEELLAMATGLATRALSWPGMARPIRRRWALMAASGTAEAWVIAWPPGGAIELHDHGGSAGAVVVAAGELVETSIISAPSGAVGQRTTTIGAQGSISFDGRHVHDIVNLGAVPALSVHVYAPRLTSMTYYRVVEGALEAGATVRYLFGEAVP